MWPIFVELPFPGINPAFLTIPHFEIAGIVLGPFLLRWYALSYIVGIVGGGALIRHVARKDALWGKGGCPLDDAFLVDSVFNITIGILLGGRFGYIIFYHFSFFSDQGFFSDPFLIFRIWEGGMSFHGAIIGVVLAMLVTARRRGFSFRIAMFGCKDKKRLHQHRQGFADSVTLGDLGALVAPIGLGLGRVANFINGELYGRPSDLPWAMRFPFWDHSLGRWVYSGREIPVHPSQIYEALTEGALLLLVMAVGVWRYRVFRSPGMASALFLFGYAIARIAMENFRRPTAHIGFFLFDITMGMVLSLPMIAAALLLVRYARKTRKTKR